MRDKNVGMTAMESPAIKVTSYDDDNDIFKKRQDDDDDLDKDLESFINERKDEESKQDNKYMDDDSLQESEISKLNDDKKEEKKSDDKDEKEDDIKESQDEKISSDDMKDDERERKVTEAEDNSEDKTKNDNKDEQTDDKIDDLEKGQKETMSKGEKEKSTDDEDSEPDDYNITDDQRRALQEIEFLKNEMGLPEEDPPEYDVKDRLKTLNEELANDPTPIEKLKESKVVFKDNPVDLVAPPPDYPEEETPRKEDNSKSKPSGDSESKTNHKVLIERDGKFELVNADDIEAQDLGLIVYDSQNKNNNSNSGDTQDFNRKPAPPSQPRPSTANGSSSRRNVRPTTSKPRASSAGPHRGPVLGDFNYNSPYAMSKEEKDLQKKQSSRKEEQQKKKQQQEKKEMEERQNENNEAFQAWLRQKREQHKRQREQEQKEKKRNAPEDHRKDSDSDFNGTESNESIQNEQSEDVKAAYKDWVKNKVTQIRKEKLLKKRLEMEATDGFYIRSREECDQAFKSWLRHKNSEAKKARMIEKQRSRLHRLAARRTRKAMALTKAVTFSDSFRYVDYYGNRY